MGDREMYRLEQTVDLHRERICMQRDITLKQDQRKSNKLRENATKAVATGSRWRTRQQLQHLRTHTSQKLGSVTGNKSVQRTGRWNIALKDFQITNTYDTSKEFTVDNAAGDGTAREPYTWTLENVPVGTEVELHREWL